MSLRDPTARAEAKTFTQQGTSALLTLPAALTLNTEVCILIYDEGLLDRLIMKERRLNRLCDRAQSILDIDSRNLILAVEKSINPTRYNLLFVL